MLMKFRLRSQLRHFSQCRTVMAAKPLDPEWSDLVKKELKGKRSADSLTWETPEVRIRRFRSSSPCGA